MTELGYFFLKCLIAVVGFGAVSFIVVVSIDCVLMVLRKHQEAQSEIVRKSLKKYRLLATESKNDVKDKYFN